MSLGERLRELREKIGWSQLKAAKHFGITNGALSNYERNYREPDADLLNKFASTYGVTVDYLLGRTSEKAEKASESKVKKIELLDLLEDKNTEIYAGGEPIKPEQKLKILEIIAHNQDDKPEASKTTNLEEAQAAAHGISDFHDLSPETRERLAEALKILDDLEKKGIIKRD